VEIADSSNRKVNPPLIRIVLQPFKAGSGTRTFASDTGFTQLSPSSSNTENRFRACATPDSTCVSEGGKRSPSDLAPFGDDLLEHLPSGRIFLSRVTRNWSSTAQSVTPDASGIYSELAPSDIQSALDRVRKSRTIGSSERLVQFLTFVVQATLNGEHLKETTIGVSVFGCQPDYDPKADAIVRSQAWRLRIKLREYYATEGAQDPLIIDLPKGHYVPVFSPRSTKRG
jgi:hypothetical protein